MCLIVLLLSVLPGLANAQRVAVRAGKLLDVKSGQLLEDRVVFIENGDITAVTPFSQYKAEPGVQMIDLGRNKTLLPGLIDSHVHVTFASNGTTTGWMLTSPSRAALQGARNARTLLEAGFTTVRNVGAIQYSDVALRDAIDAGDVPGPRMLTAANSICITGGHCDFSTALPPEMKVEGDGAADGPVSMEQKVREQIKYGADLIKITATGGVMSARTDPRFPHMTLEEIQAVVKTAHGLGRKVAAHAHAAEGVKRSVEAGVDSIEHGHMMDDAAIALMKAKGTYLVPTVYLCEYNIANLAQSPMPEFNKRKMKLVCDVGVDNARKAIQAGVKIAFGTDTPVFPHGMNAREFATLVRLGMTPLAAIRSATLNAADLLGTSDKMGAIEVGKYADLVAVDGNPLENIKLLEDVKFVMKGGAVIRHSN
ncbi:Xaa-Pro dipeptidase [Bryobacterales bacterium F-183]|nr:Xaa-Pro dipeptidase [Bryobacterales bacterium F-183]